MRQFIDIADNMSIILRNVSVMDVPDLQPDSRAAYLLSRLSSEQYPNVETCADPDITSYSTLELVCGDSLAQIGCPPALDHLCRLADQCGVVLDLYATFDDACLYSELGFATSGTKGPLTRQPTQ